MTREDAIRANRAIIQLWIDDTDEHSIANRYFRAVAMTWCAIRNPHTPTPEALYKAAELELAASQDLSQSVEHQNTYAACALILVYLASKLHPVPADRS